MLPDESYFHAVYTASYRSLLRYAMLRLPDPFDAEDALQNVYTRFLRRLSRYGHADIAEPTAFLLSMLRREIADHYASRAAQLEHETPLEEALIADDTPDPALRVATRQEAQAVFDAARALPPECYRTFVLYYGFELSVDEIARELHVGREAVKSRLFRARRSLRAQLTQKGELAL